MSTTLLARDDLVLCSGTLRHLGVVDTARVAAATGFDGISVYIHEVRAALAEGWTLATLRDLLDDLGLAVAEVDGPVDWLPGGRSTAPRAAPVDEAVTLAAGLRARSITAIETTGQRVGIATPLDVAAEGFSRFCAAAADHGVLVHIEYFPFSGIADLATAQAVVAAAGHANGGILVDVWHHQRGPDDGDTTSLRDVAPWVLGIQLNDAAVTAGPDIRTECMHDRALPGEGSASSTAIISALRAGGCEAPVGVEVFSDELDAMDPVEAATVVKRAARRVTAAARWPI